MKAFDRESFLEKLDGDLGVAGEIAGIFIEDYARGIAMIRDAVAAGDLLKVKREAHSIKGAVGNFSAADAYQAAFELEKAAADASSERIPDLVESLHRQVSILLPALQELQVEGQSA